MLVAVCRGPMRFWSLFSGDHYYCFLSCCVLYVPFKRVALELVKLHQKIIPEKQVALHPEPRCTSVDMRRVKCATHHMEEDAVNIPRPRWRDSAHRCAQNGRDIVRVREEYPKVGMHGWQTAKVTVIQYRLCAHEVMRSQRPVRGRARYTSHLKRVDIPATKRW